ncbi:MAG TPA: hypothetical protein VJ226_16615, partial [Bradyrhizobium sp.]|nr:hypothetical protein [Bradyrhizobium sp.]
HDPCVDVDRQGENRPPDRCPGDLVDDDQVHDRVVNLHDVEWTRGVVFFDDRGEYGPRRGGACRATIKVRIPVNQDEKVSGAWGEGRA